MLEPKGRGVLDAPLSRGMTAVRMIRAVIASQRVRAKRGPMTGSA
jgi:hypothetical protein